MMAWWIAVVLLGGANGLRSFTPIAVLCWFAFSGHLQVQGTWANWTAHLITAIVLTVFAVGELVGDKLPQTPSRTAPFPLGARIVFGGLVGAIVATCLHEPIIAGILPGSVCAIAGTFLGFWLRRWLTAERKLPDLPVALAEDAVTILLSIFAMRIVAG